MKSSFFQRFLDALTDPFDHEIIHTVQIYTVTPVSRLHDWRRYFEDEDNPGEWHDDANYPIPERDYLL